MGHTGVFLWKRIHNNSNGCVFQYRDAHGKGRKTQQKQKVILECSVLDYNLSNPLNKHARFPR
jgi:hypothetical protein